MLNSTLNLKGQLSSPVVGGIDILHPYIPHLVGQGSKSDNIMPNCCLLFVVLAVKALQKGRSLALSLASTRCLIRYNLKCQNSLSLGSKGLKDSSLRGMMVYG